MEGQTSRFDGGLHNFAVFTASATFGLVIAGALVTSNDAGLAVPDWPLSYGTWMPPMVGGIFYEHSHRLIATLVGVLTTILTLWLLLREPRRWARRLGLVALGAVATQGILGGLAFWLLGLSAPVFWGVVMAILCLLPFGAWVIWAPAAIWLMFTGSVVRGIILAAVGAGIVSAVDNFLRPLLLSGHSEMNGLLLFISLLGGVIAFGTVGLVLGPVLMATAVAVYEAFTSESAPPPSEPLV